VSDTDHCKQKVKKYGEIMNDTNELSRLEHNIDQLLTGYRELRAKHDRVQQELSELRSENQQLKDSLTGIDDDRSEIQSRIGALIERIESWEQEIQQTPDVYEPDGHSDTGSAGEPKEVDDSKVFVQSDEAERYATQTPESEDGGEASGSVQGSLFRA
jgi:predicted nuclease with TOPRIM domain